MTLPDPIHATIGGAEVATYLLTPSREPLGDVVLCHGTPWSASVWARVVRELSADYRILLWDMPGYGNSTMDPSVPLDLPTQMARFAKILEYHKLDRPHVVAHDIGGAVALGAHLLHGADYADLFLWDIVTLDPWGSPFFRLVADYTHVFAELPPDLHRALVKEYIAGAAGRRLDSDELEALTKPWLGETGQSAFYRQIAALRPEHTRPLAERLDQVRCPTRIGWGSEDPWIPIEQAAELSIRLPGSPRVIALDGVGHLTPVEDPTAVASALGEWFAASG